MPENEINSIPEASAELLTPHVERVPLASLGIEAEVRPYPWPGFKRQWSAFLGIGAPLLLEIAREFPALARQAGIEVREAPAAEAGEQAAPLEPATAEAREEGRMEQVTKVVALIMRHLQELQELPELFDGLITDSGCLEAAQVSRLSAADALRLGTACLASLVLTFAEVRGFLPDALRAAAVAWQSAATKLPSNTSSEPEPEA